MSIQSIHSLTVNLDIRQQTGHSVNEASIVLPITASMVPGARVLAGLDYQYNSVTFIFIY